MTANLLRLILLGWLASCLPCARGGTNDVAEAKARWEVVRTLKLGDSEDFVRKALAQCEEKDLRSFTNEHVRLSAPLDGQPAAAWLVFTNQGVAQHVIAVFSKEGGVADLL